MRNGDTVKVNQIWRNKKVPTYQLLICGTHGGRWKTKILSNKAGVYKGSHTVTARTLWERYELI